MKENNKNFNKNSIILKWNVFNSKSKHFQFQNALTSDGRIGDIDDKIGKFPLYPLPSVKFQQGQGKITPTNVTLYSVRKFNTTKNTNQGAILRLLSIVGKL